MSRPTTSDSSSEYGGLGRLASILVSPYGLAMISYALFLFAWLIPPSIYMHYVQEPDLMFLDPATMLFYSLCVAAFIAGAGFVGWVFPASITRRAVRPRIPSVLFVLIPVLFGMAATAFTMFQLVKQIPDIFLMLLSQQGADLKEALALDVEGNLMLAPLLLAGITWWAFWRSSELGLQGWRKRVVTVALYLAVLTVIVASILTLIRNLLMLIVCGLVILYVRLRLMNGQTSAKTFIKFGVAFAGGISALFMGFSLLRGSIGWDDQLHTLMGYTIASYNRLAAIVNGKMHYPFAGHGVYLSYVADYSHALNAIFPFSKVINPPPFLDLWASEFGAVSRAGLDGTLIWSGAFGYIFSELGWYSPLLIFGIGILYGMVWNWFKRGTAAGVTIYPYLGYCVLTWFGTNSIFDSSSEAILAAAILIAGYEYLFSTGVKHVAIERPINGMAREGL